MEGNRNIGRRIGRYRLIEEIGHGGMAVVYRALDTTLDRDVAIKVLHPHLASHVESRERFHREARAVARLRHPNVLEIYDYSDLEGVEVYIVMELVRGTSLRKFLSRGHGGPLSAEAAALVMGPVVAALAHAHANGIVHRDVKPENILIGKGGQMKLSDFGIAHLAGVSQMTVTGQILGSPAYMSPDHIEMEELDARADVFSVGTVLYEMAVGRTPFEGRNSHAIIKKIVEGRYRDPLSANPVVGHQLAKIIRRCLAVKPENRYGAADELTHEIDAMLVGMNIEPSAEELAKYFADPELWNGKRRQEIISRTMNLGMGARRARRFPEAIDHFNRVLAMEPGNEKALAAVRGMGRRRRTRRVLERILFVAPVIIALVAVVWALARRSSESDGAPANAREAPAVAPSPDASLPLSSNDVRDAGTGEISPVLPRAKKRKYIPRPVNNLGKQTRVVVFTPQPMAVEIVIDDVARFPFGPANRKKSIRVGKHKITFLPNDPKRFSPQTWKVKIPEGEGPYQFRRRLRWRPAKLFVESNVDKASVTIPGRASDRVNRVFDVPIDKGPDEQISVLVSAEGYVPRTHSVKISAGDLARIRVTLLETK